MPKITTELDLELAKWNAKTAQIKLDMKQLSAAARKESVGDALMGKVGTLAAGFSVAGAVAGLRSVAEHFDAVSDAADKMGESTDTIQRVQFAAEQSGTSLEGISNSFIKLEKALGDVENSKAREALENLGLTAEQIAAMPLDEKIIAFSAAFEQARATGTGVNDIMALLGKSAADLIPLFAQGEEGIRAMLADAPVLAGEAVDALAQLNDEMDALGVKAQTVGAKFAVNAGLQLEAIWRWMGSNKSMDSILTKMGEEMNERSETSARRRNRPKTAVNTSDAAAEAKAAKEQEDADKKAAKEQEDADKKAAKADEDRAKRIRDLQADIESKRISLLPSAEQLAEFKSKLQALLEDVDFVDPTMAGLDEAIRMAGDPAEEERLLVLKKEALELQSKISGLEKPDAAKMETVRTAATPGSVTAAINTIFGRSANELVLDETKRQTQVLERIDKGIQKLADGSPGSLSGNEVFQFP